MFVVMHLPWWFCCFWTVMTASWLKQKPASKEKPFASILYTAVVRGKVALPCDISSPSVNDSAALVLWYKDDSAQPIYTLDARRGNVDQAHQSSSPQLESRAYFNMINRPAFLQLDPVKEDDAGEYRCRVDFHKARTVNTVITLKVIVPPREPVIADEDGKQLKGLVGPFNEGQSLTLMCSVTGGKPRPSLTWWQDYTLLDDNYTFSSDEVVINKIVIPEIQRDDLRTVLTCQASNNNITIPASTTITLKLNLKPVELDIIQSQRTMSTNKEVKLTCIARGSRPPATITWWKGSQQISPSGVRVTTEGDTTTSSLLFTPSVEDNGKHVSCKAENLRIPDSEIQKGLSLEVHYPPIVSLRVVSDHEKVGISEYDDVIFECDIQAHPWVNSIDWYFNGRRLTNDPLLGVLISSQSMVLQNIQRSFRGRFICSATNNEGKGVSNEIFLKVKYSPVCQPAQKFVYGILKPESVQIQCHLDADPKEVKFFWRFNSSTKVTDQIIHSVESALKSIASHNIESDEGFGTLLCWGENEIGTQKDPCVFNIIPAEAPLPVENCTVFNRTEDMILVECLEGFNGGMDQTFIMEVYSEESTTLYAKVSSQVPIFLVNGLTQGTVFMLFIYAVNRKGRSSVIQLSTSTIRQAAKLTRERSGTFVFNPVLTVFVSTTVALISVIFILIVVVKIRKRAMLKAPQQRKSSRDNSHRSEAPLQKPVEDVDDGPDIIPAKTLNRKLLSCGYDHGNYDPDEISPSHGVLVFSDTTYDVKAETVALQKIPSFSPEDGEQKEMTFSEANRNSRREEKCSDYQMEETEVTEQVMIKKRESVV